MAENEGAGSVLGHGPPSAVTFVTIVFEAELALLVLQARSFALFVPVDAVAEILVVENTRRPTSASWRRSLAAAYGPHARSVRFVRRDELVDLPSASGWRSQQVLKLAVAREVRTEVYVVLDAKNHFVLPTSLPTFVAADGRPRANFHHYDTHPLRSSLEAVLDYFCLERAPRIARFTATATPFILVTTACRDLIRSMEVREGAPFVELFLRHSFTEFFLYSGWLQSEGVVLDELYDDGGIRNETVWPRGRNRSGVSATLERAVTLGSPLLSIHRTALARMGPDATSAVIGFWVDRGLFPSSRQAWAFVIRYRASYVVAMVAKRLRESRS